MTGGGDDDSCVGDDDNLLLAPWFINDLLVNLFTHSIITHLNLFFHSFIHPPLQASSPFREPLVKFLKKHPEAVIDYFFTENKLQDAHYNRFFLVMIFDHDYDDDYGDGGGSD